MRTVSLVSLQSSRSVDADARCERALKEMWPRNVETGKERFHCEQLSIVGDSFKSRHGIKTQPISSCFRLPWPQGYITIALSREQSSVIFTMTSPLTSSWRQFLHKRHKEPDSLLHHCFGIWCWAADSFKFEWKFWKISNLSPLDSIKWQQQMTKRISCSIGGMIRCYVWSW